jgi:hypothetical protein
MRYRADKRRRAFGFCGKALTNFNKDSRHALVE